MDKNSAIKWIDKAIRINEKDENLKEQKRHYENNLFQQIEERNSAFRKNESEKVNNNQNNSNQNVNGVNNNSDDNSANYESLVVDHFTIK
jgi:hypothetical protein